MPRQHQQHRTGIASSLKCCYNQILQKVFWLESFPLFVICICRYLLLLSVPSIYIQKNSGTRNLVSAQHCSMYCIKCWQSLHRIGLQKLSLFSTAVFNNHITCVFLMLVIHIPKLLTLALKCILKILGKMFEVLEIARTKFSFNF